MKLIRTEEAVGHVLCHDMTQIIKDQYKDARFRKGHIVTEDDIPVLLSMGKENLYVWEMTPGMVHENDAAERLLDVLGLVLPAALMGLGVALFARGMGLALGVFGAWLALLQPGMTCQGEKHDVKYSYYHM